MNNISKKILILGIVLILAGGGIIWYIYSQSPNKAISPDTRIYNNEELGIKFHYPSSWGIISLTKSNQSPSFLKGEVWHWGAKENPFSIYVYSRDYEWYESPLFNRVSVDPNWNKESFAAAMDVSSENTLFIKKLSSRSILVAYYDNSECSPYMQLSVLTPFNNPKYPNFEILIEEPFEDDPLVQRYRRSLTEEDYGNRSCDELAEYQQVAQKIENGTYSQELNSKIKTAQFITDSVTGQ